MITVFFDIFNVKTIKFLKNFNMSNTYTVFFRPVHKMVIITYDFNINGPMKKIQHP